MDTPESYPPLIKGFLSQTIDDRARSGYSKPYALIAKSRNPADGFEEISFARIANAIDQAAWWFDKKFAQEGHDVKTFAYIGPPYDLRYLIFAMAAFKTGRKILIPSTRNTTDAQIYLLTKTKSEVLLYGSSLETILQPVLRATASATSISIFQSPDLVELLQEGPVPPYPCNRDFEKVANEPFLILHSSGTSGNPKPIQWSPAYVATIETFKLLPVDQGRTFVGATQNRRILSLIPAFHAAGMVYTMCPVLNDATVVLSHPDVPPTAEYISKLLDQGGIDGLISPPSILEDLTKIPTAVERLSRLKYIAYTGGPLPKHAGDFLASKVQSLMSAMGQTEYGWYHVGVTDSSKWQYLKFMPGIGYEFDEVSEGVFEIFVRRDEKTKKFHGIFFDSLPGISDEYRSKDLYAPHPEILGLWRYLGRTDDLIVLSNGEKVDPNPMETVLKNDPRVSSALIVGESRFLPSLLIELATNDPLIKTSNEEKLNQIWPVVQEANKIAPGFARLTKSLILFTNPEKPFARAGKGTVQRQKTVASYADELKELYSGSEQSLLIDGLTLGDLTDEATVKKFTREIYLHVFEHPGLTDEDDVFDLGIDSLRVFIIVQRLQAALKACHAQFDVNKVNPQLIYSFPTIGNISKAMNSLIASGGNKLAETLPPAELMKQFIEKYSSNIITPSASDNTSSSDANNPIENEPNESNELDEQDGPKPWTIILTGSTGSLGTYLLSTLMNLSTPHRISKIYCLNRTRDSHHRQVKANHARGLRTDFGHDPNPLVEFLHADLSQPTLGLSLEKYNALLGSVTAILHCAWKVDFNHPLRSFERTHIAGVRHLFDFTLRSPLHPPLIFLSSISSTLAHLAQNPHIPLPESVIHDLHAPDPSGYAQSKQVSELLLETLSKKTETTTTAILRIGQIAGPSANPLATRQTPSTQTPPWNKSEWFPSLLASSKYLRLLPSFLGPLDTIDWIPVDILADIIVELTSDIIMTSSSSQPETGTGTTTASNLKIYNLTNPHTIPWSTLAPETQNLLSRSLDPNSTAPSDPNPNPTSKNNNTQITLAPLPTWVTTLSKSTSSSSSASPPPPSTILQNPATKLLFFFERLAGYEDGTNTTNPNNDDNDNNNDDNDNDENKKTGTKKTEHEHECLRYVTENMQRDAPNAVARLEAIGAGDLKRWFVGWV
ncbi:MAG: putative NRPS-like protein biosynthetic cluster [Cirrosporium novae-zelandiae]|nr:MAG: putative NRPS-like protein biosynthetic cluster [Cirrosporium novae-zelandiae]